MPAIGILEHPVYQDTARRKARVRQSILSLVGGAASRWSARSRGGLVREMGERTASRVGSGQVGSSRVESSPETYVSRGRDDARGYRYIYHCRDRLAYTATG